MNRTNTTNAPRPNVGQPAVSGRKRRYLGGPHHDLPRVGFAAWSARDREVTRQIGRMLDEVPATRVLLRRLLDLTGPRAVSDAERAEAVNIADIVTRVLAALSAADGDVRPPMTVRSGWEVGR